MAAIPGRQWIATTLGLGRLVWRDAQCLFVLSTGRVGTATLAKLLELSPRLDSVHEPEPSPRAYARDAFSHVWDEPGRFIEVLKTMRARNLGAAAVKGRIYTETANKWTYLAPAIQAALPRAKFIHLYRHPAEVVRSGMLRGWYSHNSLDAHRIEPLPHDPVYPDWKTLSPFAKCCWYWQAVNSFSMRFMNSLEPARTLSVSSEDLLDVNGGTYEEVFSFLGVPCPAKGAVSNILGKKHNASQNASFPPVEEWGTDLRDTLLQIARPTMEKLGYGFAGGMPRRAAS